MVSRYRKYPLRFEHRRPPRAIQAAEPAGATKRVTAVLEPGKEEHPMPFGVLER